jgi:hypothetical protein
MSPLWMGERWTEGPPSVCRNAHSQAQEVIA